MPTQSSALQAVGALESRFQRMETALSCAETRLSRERADSFADVDSRLNPLALLERVVQLERLIPQLADAAAKNAEGWKRAPPDAVLSLLETNHRTATAIAARAAADVSLPTADFAAARAGLPDSRPGRHPIQSGAHPSGSVLRGVAGASSDPESPSRTAGGSDSQLAPHPSPVVPQAARAEAGAQGEPQPSLRHMRAHVSQLQWLRAQCKPDGVGLEEVDALYGRLQDLCVERGTQQLQAAQLLARGIRLTGVTVRQLAALESMGLISREQNCIRLDGAHLA